MVTDLVINVEVTVSDELRRMLADGSGAGVSTYPSSPAEPPPDPVPVGLDWPQVVLRRDGERPLVFRGLPVMIQHFGPEEVQGPGERTLAFYLAEDRTLYASLAFVPPEATPCRPAYKCQSIRQPSDIASLVREWLPETSFDARLTQDSHQHLAAGKSAVRSAFNFFAAGSL